MAFYVKKSAGPEFFRQAVRYAADHSAIGIKKGKLRVGIPMLINDKISNKLAWVTELAFDLLKKHDLLSGEKAYNLHIKNLAIFTHGDKKTSLQAGKWGKWIGSAEDIAKKPKKRKHWIELGGWVESIAMFLSPSPKVILYSCSVGGSRPKGIPFSRALEAALRQELTEVHGPGTKVKPEVWGHTTAAHTTANPFISKVTTNTLGQQEYRMMGMLLSKFLEYAFF